MSKLVDLCGRRFGRLVVIEPAERPENMQQNRRYWKCRCDCGREKIASTKVLNAGLTKSCGCLGRDILLDRNSKHGMFGSRVYKVWGGMKSRCLNPHDPKYPIYGGRGISVCDEWNEFIPFYEWAISNGYSDSLTIDRIDVNGNYEPSNCRWATNKEQANNTRVNHFITVNGETHTASQWAEITGIKAGTILARIKRGWSHEEAISIRVGDTARPTYRQNK